MGKQYGHGIHYGQRHQQTEEPYLYWRLPSRPYLPPSKCKKMFCLFLEKYSDYDYFMIVDDDTYVYVEKLKLYLTFFDKKDLYINHDVWLHQLFKLSDGKIKRTHCPAFHQYEEFPLHLTFSKEDNQMISVHLNHNLDLLQYYHV